MNTAGPVTAEARGAAPASAAGAPGNTPKAAEASSSALSSSGRNAERDETLARHFRTATVVLYRTETGHEGQRVPTSSLALPLRTDRRSADGSRFEVMTVDGVRWIAFADLAGGPPAKSSSGR